MASLFTPFNEDFVGRIKDIPDRKWIPSRKCWAVPENSLNKVREIMRDIYGYDDLTCPYTTITFDVEEAYDPYSVIPKKGEIFIHNSHAYKCIEIDGNVNYDDFIHCTVLGSG